MSRKDVPITEDALRERVYQGLQKKKMCELCMQSFFVEELPGAITYKSILELRQKWGEPVKKGNRMPSPSQLYKRCELCVFCMQFFDVDGLQDAPGAAGTGGHSPADSALLQSATKSQTGGSPHGSPTTKNNNNNSTAGRK
jgi:hypothetical protein